MKCQLEHVNLQTMLKIRLQRTGKRGQAYFKVVVTEHTQKPKGKYLELLGSYDPHKNKITVDIEKVNYWISQGAHLSETANNLLVGKSVIEGEKVKAWKPKKKKKIEGAPAQAQVPAEINIEPQVKTKEVKEEVRVEEIAPVSTETPATNLNHI